MEVTDLKELKKLMKGDARNKFEFEEDNDVGSYTGAMNFGEKSRKKAGGAPETYQTYQNSQAQRSIDASQMAVAQVDGAGKRYEDLDSDDSELADKNGSIERNSEDDFYDVPNESPTRVKPVSVSFVIL